MNTKLKTGTQEHIRLHGQCVWNSPTRLVIPPVLHETLSFYWRPGGEQPFYKPGTATYIQPDGKSRYYYKEINP